MGMINMSLIFQSLTNFMLPSASAIIFDGTPIILLGSIILAYFTLTNINKHTTTQGIPSVEKEHNMNINTEDYSNLISFDTQPQNNKTEITKENSHEEIEDISEKEIIFNKI